MNSGIWQRLAAILRDCFEVLYLSYLGIIAWIIWRDHMTDVDKYTSMSPKEFKELDDLMGRLHDEYIAEHPP